MHDGHSHVWPLILTLTASAVAALLAGGRRLGLATGSERLYAATVAAAAGAWLSAAAAVGPAHRPLPQILLIGGSVLAVPWWAHRRPPPKVRVQRAPPPFPPTAQTIPPP